MDEDMIPVIAILMPVLMVTAIITLKHRHQRREWLYRERMRAMDLGLTGPAPGTWPAAVAAICIGAGVPIGCFLLAWLATLTAHVQEKAFIGATIVSVVAVIQGTRLATRLLGLPCGTTVEPGTTDKLAQHANGKPPVYDPDAYDVVSRRG